MKPTKIILLAVILASVVQGWAGAALAFQACYCAPDTARIDVWKSSLGAADRFAAAATDRWFRRMGTAQSRVKTEQLVILGRDSAGVWAMETTLGDGSGGVTTDLACVTNEGKRKTYRLLDDEIEHESLRSLIARRLKRLATAGRWDPNSLERVTLSHSEKPPRLLFRHKGKPEDSDYRWSLYARIAPKLIVKLYSERTHGLGGYNGAACFGGVEDIAGGRVWWVLIKNHRGEWCGAQWATVRVPPQQGQ